METEGLSWFWVAIVETGTSFLWTESCPEFERHLCLLGWFLQEPKNADADAFVVIKMNMYYPNSNNSYQWGNNYFIVHPMGFLVSCVLSEGILNVQFIGTATIQPASL